jgi:hypothetical protein
MKRLLVMCLLTAALAVPAAALAVPDGGGNGGGTLAIRGAAGDLGVPVVSLVVSGAVVGHVDSGRIVIDGFSGPSAQAPAVTGADRPARDLPTGATVYGGNDVSFRAVGGHYRIRIYGRGIDLNVVGTGTVKLQGSILLPTDGRYSLNGGTWHSLPDVADVFSLGA